jgi:membrane protease YdiL (CAAX protease family)
MENWQDIWVDRGTGQVRTGWRVLGYVAVLVLFVGLLEVFAVSLARAAGAKELLEPWPGLISDAALLVSCLVVGVWALRVFDRLPVFTLGVSPRGAWQWQFLAGVAGGAACIVLALLALMAFGGAAVRWQGINDMARPVLGLYGLVVLISGVSGTLLFLGYPFQTLLRGAGPATALALSIAAFTVPALGLNHGTPLAVANWAALALVLCLLYQRVGTLWPAMGVLVGWNAAQMLCGLPVSGKTFPVIPPLSVSVTGPAWLTGGAFGLEGSVLVSVVLLGALAAVALVRAGHALRARWWAWPELFTTPTPPPAWDFRIGERYYQWKLVHPEDAE